MRSNFLMKEKGVMLTPPLECGLLPGVMRAELLDSGDHLVREEIVKDKEVSSYFKEMGFTNPIDDIFLIGVSQTTLVSPEYPLVASVFCKIFSLPP